MGIFLGMYDLSKLNMEGIKNLKIPTVINENKSIIKELPTKKFQH